MDLVPLYSKFTIGSHSYITFVCGTLWMYQENSGLSILLEDASLMWTRESQGSMQQPSDWQTTWSITSAAVLLLLYTEHIWFWDWLVGATKHFIGLFIYQLKKKNWFIQKCCKISIAPTYYTKLQCGDWLLWTHLICNCRHCIDKEYKYNLVWYFFSWFLSFIDLLCILMNCAVYFSGWSSTSDRYL